MNKIIPCPNPTCPNYNNRNVRCWDHCNHCGVGITWRPKNLDREIKYVGPKPLDTITGEHHHGCMLGGTRDGTFLHTDPTSKDPKTGYPRIKASVIQCSHPDCIHASIDLPNTDSILIDELQKHLKKDHWIKLDPEYVEYLKQKVNYMRDSRSAYIDPFLHISWEELESSGKSITQPSQEVREKANNIVKCLYCDYKAEPYYMKYHIC